MFPFLNEIYLQLIKGGEAFENFIRLIVEFAH